MTKCCHLKVVILYRISLTDHYSFLEGREGGGGRGAKQLPTKNSCTASTAGKNCTANCRGPLGRHFAKRSIFHGISPKVVTVSSRRPGRLPNSGHDLLLLHLPLQQFQLQLLLVQLQVHLHQLLLHGKIMVWPTLVLYHANGWSRQLPRALNALLLLWPWPQFPLLALRPHLSRLRRFVGCPIDFRQEATIGLRRGDPFTTLRMAAPHHDMEHDAEQV